MRDAVREVEAAFRAMGEGRTEVRPRQRVRIPGGILNIMAAAWADRGYYGFKDYAVSKEGIRFWVHLFDARTGSAVAIIQADRMGQRRTGAASGVAARHLARRGAATVGLIGTGWQAETQLEALCEVRDIRRARCYSRRPSKRGVFARRMSSALGIDVRPVDSARAAVRGTDIVVTATSAKTPVLRGEWLEPGMHVNAIGANRRDTREVDEEAVRCAELIAIDSIEQGQIEAGDLILPVSRGQLRWDWIRELGSIVAGTVSGRSSEEDITLFKSLGIALEDIAVGAFVFERAREAGVGTEIPL